MIKILMALFITATFLFSNEENQNSVKTSELELFLFKIGFESLLKDVDITKEKASLNSSELEKLNKKIELIMNEIYKDKRVITNDANVVNSSSNNDLVFKEINLLKQEIKELKKQLNEKKVQVIQVEKKRKIDFQNSFKAVVKANELNVRSKGSSNATIVEVLLKGAQLEIDSCDKYSWCKIKDEEKYVSKNLIKASF